MKRGILYVLALAVVSQLGACVSDDATIRVSWRIVVNGQVGSCASVGASKIHVEAERTSNGRTKIVEFDCVPDGIGDFDITPGAYTVTIDLIDAAGNALNSVPIVQSVDVDSGERADLGPFDFTFNIAFHATFQVKMGDDPNCVRAALEEVQLLSGNQCLQATMSGLLDASNRPITGSTCSKLVCQPQSVVHSLDNLAPGSYSVAVIGYKGATGSNPVACYISSAVPLQITNTDKNLGTIVATFNDTANPTICNATKPEEA